MSDQGRQSGDVRIFGIAIRRSAMTRIQGGVFSLLGLGWLVEALILDEPLGWWKVLQVVLGVLSVALGLLLLFARVVHTSDNDL